LDQFIYIILEIFSKTGKNQDALWQVRKFLPFPGESSNLGPV